MANVAMELNWSLDFNSWNCDYLNLNTIHKGMVSFREHGWSTAGLALVSEPGLSGTQASARSTESNTRSPVY